MLAICCRRRAARRRLRRRRAPGRARTEGHASRWRSSTRSFPAVQSIARPTQLVLRVRNTGAQHGAERGGHDRLVRLHRKLPRTGRHKRPVWVDRTGPRGRSPRRPSRARQSARPAAGRPPTSNTWALGPLAPGSDAQTFIWRVVPVKAGLHTVHYTVSAGLAGKAKAVNRRRRPGAGALRASTSPLAPAAHVNPDTGQVEPARSRRRQSRASARAGPGGQRGRAMPIGRAPSRGVWPAVERSPARFRHAVMPFRRLGITIAFGSAPGCARVEAGWQSVERRPIPARRNRPSPCPRHRSRPQSTTSSPAMSP